MDTGLDEQVALCLTAFGTSVWHEWFGPGSAPWPVGRACTGVRRAARACTATCAKRVSRLQVKSPGDARNFEAEKAKDDVDTSYKSTGLFADF